MNMSINQKVLGLLIALCLTGIATFLIAYTRAEENKQHLFEYKIRADDTCTKIAVNFSVSVVSIIEVNDLKRDCSNIHAGQVLLIPYPTPLGSPVATFRNIVIDCDHEIYTVKDGDTLDAIANNYKTSKEVIIDHNGLLKDKLTTGMQLAIPLCCPTPTP